MVRAPSEPTLRRWAVAVFMCTAAGAAIAVACSSFDEGATPPSDAAADGAGDVVDADVPPGTDASADGGLVPTPGTFACFESACDLSTNHCCYSNDAGAVCKASCSYPADNFDFQCDDWEDCARRRCCVEFSFFALPTSVCRTSCGANIQLCATNEECPVGSTCVVKECRGRLVGTCGDVDISSFCNLDAGVPDAG